MTQVPSLTVVLPAFNEEQGIERAIVACRDVAAKVTQDYEIIVIDDGSYDQTRKIIEQFASKDAHIRGVFLPGHLGYGKALSAGFSNARKELIFYTDSDLPIEVEKELPRAMALISREADVVVGYRKNRGENVLRKAYSLIYNFMNRLLFGVVVKDVNFSCKLFRRQVFDKVKLNTASVFVDGELLAKITAHGFRIKEFPVTYMKRKYGRSNFNSLFYACGILLEMFVFWITNYLKPRLAKIKNN